MKQAMFIVMISCLHIALIMLIIKHICYAVPDEQNCHTERPAHIHKATPLSPATLQQLHNLFDTSEKSVVPVHDAMDIYTNTVQALPKISTALERLCNAYAKQAYHDQAYTAYATAYTLNPSSPHSFILFNHTIRQPSCTQLT